MLNTSSANFGDKLKKARTQAGHSQTTLAEAIGSSSGSVSNWETGVNVPRGESLEKLNKELFPDQAPKSSPALTIKSPTSKKAGPATTAGNSKSSLKDFDTDDLAKELKRRGYSVTLVV